MFILKNNIIINLTRFYTLKLITFQTFKKIKQFIIF